MAFSRNGRKKQSNDKGHDSGSDAESEAEGADMSKNTDEAAELTPATSDEFDVLGSRVAEILRTADTAAEDRRAEAETYAAKVYAEADELRAKAAEEGAEAERIRRLADLRLEQAETRLASIETELGKAKAQAQELVSAAEREREGIIDATIRGAEEQLTRVTHHLQSRVKEIQRDQAEAAEQLSSALKTLEALEGDIKILDPESVLDLTGVTASVGSEHADSDRDRPDPPLPAEPALATTVDSLSGNDTPPAVGSSAVEPSPPVTDDDSQESSEQVVTDAASEESAAAGDRTWLEGVVRTAVGRAMDESENADDPALRRF